MCPVTSLRVVDGHFPANLSMQFSSIYVAAPTRLRPTRTLRSFGTHTLAPDDGELGLFDSEGNAGNWFVISEPM